MTSVTPSKPDTVSRAEREAACWVADQQSGLLDDAGSAHLEAWLQTAENAAALKKAQALWLEMGEAVVRAGAPAALASRRCALRLSGGRSSRAPLIATGMAAALAIAFVALDGPTRLRADVITRPGEQKMLTLADGSTVHLNTDSAIQVVYAPDRRIVRLLRGEAAFTVAPNSKRPFTVEAGGGSTTALGTRFIVRRSGVQTQVSVTEHSVRVASNPASVVVAQDQTSTYDPNQPPSAPFASSVGVGAWQDGWLVFDDQPLSTVVSEIGRYSALPMTVIGRKARDRRVSGAFRIDQPAQTVKRLEQTLGLHATQLLGGPVILHD
nr:FecR domain-containing protein [uncultured Brevundimonas sp.]